MASSLHGLKELMLGCYPDASELNFIVSSERGKGFVQNYAHREVGGLLPSFRSFDEYKAEVLAERSGLRKIERKDELVALTLYLLEHSPKHREDAGFAAFNMLPAIRYACMFSLERERMQNLRGIRAEQIAKIDELFDVTEKFDRFLEAEGLFMPLLREHEFAGHIPGEKDFFINLPLFTPATETFFKRLPPERKLVDMPAYADAFRESKPDYASSLHLLEKAGIAAGKSAKPGLFFHELQGKPTLASHIRKEIGSFLQGGQKGGQLVILLLDEALSFYLWQTVFKALGGLVNFSVGLPLAVTAAGARVSRFIEAKKGERTSEDFSRFRRGLAHELIQHRNEYVREELYALEAAIDFVDGLERHHEPLGDAFGQVAGLLLQQQQFFLKGDRSAPVQVVGLGEATGVPFERGMVLPLNGDAFPSKIYNGPFLNFVHTPQIRDAHMEMEDLGLRQFMSFGQNIDLVSVFDEARGMAPSFFFTFLKNEFGGSITRCAAPMIPARSRDAVPFVENDTTTREKILAHSFSFSSLSHLLTCPFCFYFADIERLPTPDVMEDEQNINLILGSFVHEFFNRLTEEANPREVWKNVFKKVWDKNPGIAQLKGRGLFRLILFGQLEALSEHENEEERLLLFGGGRRSAEKKLEACFGDGGRFKLNGRLDGVVEASGAWIILDYKYKSSQPIGRKSLIEALANENAVDPRLQIGLYAYLLAQNRKIALETIRGYFVYIREDDPAKRFQALEEPEISQVGKTMGALSGRIEQILSLERFEPNYKSSGCRFCLYKSLCKVENFYRASQGRS